MATIPMGNFGQAIARPGPTPTLRTGDPIGQAVERVGQVASNVINDMAEQETRQRLEAKAAADRAESITALTGTRDKLNQLHDQVYAGVLDGTVPKEKAESEFASQSAKVLQGVGATLPEAQRTVLLAELNSDATRLGGNVRKAVTQRLRQDVTANITTSLEHLQREYRTDPEKATTRAMALIDQLGPQSTMAPDQLAKLKQGWREGTQYTAGYELVTRGRADRAALDAAERTITEGLPDIDPQKRAVLLDRVAAYRLRLDQQAELVAARAQREAERRMRTAEAEFNTFSALADKGTILDPDYIDRVLTATAGTPYQGGVRALAQQARESGGLAAQPVNVQQATLDGINALIAQQGRSPELDRRKEQVEKVLRGSREDMQRDALRAGLERGVITDLPPLNLAAGPEGVAAQMAGRVQRAATVSTWAGRPVSPMTPDEAAQLARQFRTLSPEQKATSVAALVSTMPPQQAAALAQQIDGQDRALALAMGISNLRTTRDRLTAELVLRGAQVLRDRGVKEDRSAEFGLQASLAKEVGDSMSGKPREDVIEAARLIYLAKQAEGETMSVGGAVRLALGGPIVEHNGRRIPVPAGVDADTLRSKLRALPASSIAAQAPGGQVLVPGGSVLAVDEFLRLLPDAQLEVAGHGRYMVRSGGGLVLNTQRAPIVVEVR